jgi:NADPH2:quinone reductase
MKATVYYENGGPEVLRYEDVPDPICGPDQILLQVQAVSIEGGDLLYRWGAPPPVKPYIVGYQAAGIVREVGANVQGYEPGMRVTSVGANGSHAELRAVHVRAAHRVPDGLSIEAAATVPVPYSTADDCLFEYGRLQPGETVLVQAGASGVGLAAVQLAKRHGATVLATASSRDKLERLREYGVDHGIDYKAEDLVARVKELTAGRGADVIVDGVGGDVTQQSFRACAPKGRVCMYGNVERGSFMYKYDLNPMRGNRAVIGVSLASEAGTDRVRAIVARHLQAMARGELRAVIDRSFPLQEAAAAHAYIESRKSFGRVLLVP